MIQLKMSSLEGEQILLPFDRKELSTCHFIQAVQRRFEEIRLRRRDPRSENESIHTRCDGRGQDDYANQDSRVHDHEL